MNSLWAFIGGLGLFFACLNLQYLFWDQTLRNGTHGRWKSLEESGGRLLSVSASPLSKNNATSTSEIYGCSQNLYTQGLWQDDDGENSNSKKKLWVVGDAKNCKLERMETPQLFCETLKGRNMLIVGDSIHFQLYTWMLKQVGATKSKRVHQYQKLRERSVQVHIGAEICNGTVHLTYLRNDHLSFEQELQDKVDEKLVTIPWLHLLPYHVYCC
jgi:hypothetical protein